MGRVLLSCIIVSLYYCNMQNAHVTIINDLLTYLLTIDVVTGKCNLWQELIIGKCPIDC